MLVDDRPELPQRVHSALHRLWLDCVVLVHTLAQSGDAQLLHHWLQVIACDQETERVRSAIDSSFHTGSVR